jgi:CTP synthase (UTP-ammonia lyase)
VKEKVRIAIIGDYTPDHFSHVATNNALIHAGAARLIQFDVEWLHTADLSAGNIEDMLYPFHGIWCGPKSPYASADGALSAIRFARERLYPFIAT